jgi:hypothetical protein
MNKLKRMFKRFLYKDLISKKDPNYLKILDFIIDNKQTYLEKMLINYQNSIIECREWEIAFIDTKFLSNNQGCKLCLNEYIFITLKNNKRYILTGTLEEIEKEIGEYFYKDEIRNKKIDEILGY